MKSKFGDILFAFQQTKDRSKFERQLVKLLQGKEVEIDPKDSSHMIITSSLNQAANTTAASQCT
jgi:hypothetical protein